MPAVSAATPLWGYGLAVGATALALGLTLLFQPVLAATPSALFLFAVISSTWVGGLRAGLLATVCATAALDYFFFPPVHSFTFRYTSDLVLLAVYAGVSVIFSLVTAARKRAEEELSRTNAALRHEIAERQQVAEAERAQRQYFQVTLASIGDAVIVTDAAGRVTFLNPVAQTLTGWAPDEATGRPLAEVFHIVNEESRRPMENPVAKVLTEGVIAGLANHTVLLARDGTEYPIDDSAAPICDEQGQLLGVVLVFRDITGRRQAERALQASRDQLAVILQSVAEGITAQAPTGQLLYANEAAAQLIGYPSVAALLQAPVAEVMRQFVVLDAEGRPFPLEQLPGRRALQGQRNAEALVRFRVLATGEERWSLVRAAPVVDAEGRVQLAVNVFRDVTALKRTEEAQRFLAEASKILSASLDYEDTLTRVAQLAVPRLADWCAVYIAQDDGLIYPLAVAHADPAKVAWARELQQRYPMPADTPYGVPNVLRTGRAEVYPHITDAQLVTAARGDAEILRILRELNLHSLMIVPLTARGRTLGAMSFTVTDSGRQYGAEDVALAEQLAERAALAIDNARLYREAQAEIAERTRAEEALRLSEERFVKAFRAVPDAMSITRADGTLLDVNDAWVRLFGYRREEAIGNTPLGLNLYVDPTDRERLWSRLREEGAVREYGLAVRRRSGEVRQVSLSVELITVQGELCTLTVARDVTEHRQMEAALRESEARFRATFEQAAVGMAHVSPDGRWLLVNQRLCEILGYPREELLTRTFQDLTYPEDLPADLEAVRRLLAGDLTSYSLEKRYRRKDGTLVWAHLTVSLVEVTPPYFIAVIEDITARKQMEEALVRQAEELRRSNDELQQFAYVASHDLQEPLRMVSTYVELLAKRYRGQLDADADEFIGYAVEGAQRMKALIDGLLAYSRVESQGRALQPTDSEAVFQRVLTDLQPAIAESGATITHEPLPAVRADAVQLGQVLQNLLSNALKFRGTAPPSIHVAAQRDGAFWRFAVRDNGIGIDPRYAQRIFQMFQRLHTRGKYPGTGIGLAICKRIIERHGGRIWVESEPGTGATFFFTLPAPTEGKPA